MHAYSEQARRFERITKCFALWRKNAPEGFLKRTSIYKADFDHNETSHIVHYFRAASSKHTSNEFLLPHDPENKWTYNHLNAKRKSFLHQILFSSIYKRLNTTYGTFKWQDNLVSET